MHKDARLKKHAQKSTKGAYMRRSKCFMARALALALVFGMLFLGCSTTQYGVAISNVSNIREVYIRNVGTSNWGTNIAGSLQDIDRSRFSAQVDIKVIDTNGITYSKYNVPFDDYAFVETSKERYVGTGTQALGILALAAILIPVLVVKGGEQK